MARNQGNAPFHIVAQPMPVGSTGFPTDIAPSMVWGGLGLQDARLTRNVANGPNGAGVIGWYGAGIIKVAGLVPSAIATANIAALAHVVNGTAMTLVTSTGSGITVSSAAQIALPSLNTFPAGTLFIDGAPTYTDFATNASLGGGTYHTKFYNISTCVGRGVSISGVSGGAGGAFLVSGADTYGYPMTQTITVAAGANTVNSTKALKAIYSVVPQFTDAHNYSVGTADLWGFGMYSTIWPDVLIYWGTPPNPLQAVAGGTYTAGVTTTATSSTGDVRGTWAPTTNASDGTKRLDIFQIPTVTRMTTPYSNLWGVAQA
jgi:hypothetical protein